MAGDVRNAQKAFCRGCRARHDASCWLSAALLSLPSQKTVPAIPPGRAIRGLRAGLKKVFVLADLADGDWGGQTANKDLPTSFQGYFKQSIIASCALAQEAPAPWWRGGFCQSGSGMKCDDCTARVCRQILAANCEQAGFALSKRAFQVSHVMIIALRFSERPGVRKSICCASRGCSCSPCVPARHGAGCG